MFPYLVSKSLGERQSLDFTSEYASLFFLAHIFRERGALFFSFSFTPHNSFDVFVIYYFYLILRPLLGQYENCDA